LKAISALLITTYTGPAATSVLTDTKTGARAAIKFSPKTLTSVQVQPAIGLNKFDLLLQYLGLSSGSDNTSAIFYKDLEQAMAKKAIIDAEHVGITYLRVSATGFAPSAYNQPGDLDLYLSNPAAYFSLF